MDDPPPLPARASRRGLARARPGPSMRRRPRPSTVHRVLDRSTDNQGRRFLVLVTRRLPHSRRQVLPVQSQHRRSRHPSQRRRTAYKRSQRHAHRRVSFGWPHARRQHNALVFTAQGTIGPGSPSLFQTPAYPNLRSQRSANEIQAAATRGIASQHSPQLTAARRRCTRTLHGPDG
jgi:hypothetical protein